MPAQDPGNCGHAVSGLAELGDQVSFVFGELAVLHGLGSFLAGSESLPVCQLTSPFRGAGFVALSLAISVRKKARKADQHRYSHTCLFVRYL